MNASEGHPCTTDVSIRIEHERTVIQESLSLIGIDMLEAAETCCALYLTGYAHELESIVAEDRIAIKKVKVTRNGHHRNGEVELELHGRALRRNIHVAVSGCSGIRDAEARARAQIGAIAAGLRKAMAARVSASTDRLGEFQTLRPPVELIEIGIRAAAG